jgi:hypothetical protein
MIRRNGVKTPVRSAVCHAVAGRRESKIWLSNVCRNVQKRTSKSDRRGGLEGVVVTQTPPCTDDCFSTDCPQPLQNQIQPSCLPQITEVNQERHCGHMQPYRHDPSYPKQRTRKEQRSRSYPKPSSIDDSVRCAADLGKVSMIDEEGMCTRKRCFSYGAKCLCRHKVRD